MESAQGVSKSHYLRWLAIGLPIAISLPMAWISLSKLVLLLTGASVLVQTSLRDNSLARPSRFTWWVIVTLAAFGLSLLWTEVPFSHAAYTWIKHAKILIIPLLLALLGTASLSHTAIRSLVLTQGVIMLLSWGLYLGISIPIPAQAEPGSPIIFATSYIDQAAMFAITSALAWHLRNENIFPRWIGYLLPVVGLCSILLVLPGRTGYVMVLVLLGLGSWWQVPKQWRLLSGVMVPLLILGASLSTSNHVRDRIGQIYKESIYYTQQSDASSSAGWRLNAWLRSSQAIASRPITGFGVGSFVPAVKRFETGEKDQIFGTSLSSNPHQEFLLWGVELGLLGVILLATMFFIVITDAQRFALPVRNATLSVLAVICVACFFNSALYDDLIGDFLCYSLGFCLSLGKASPREHE